ncbi:MAG: chemotaxis protein CheR [Archangium gephyra]|uniref:protein-glutamate O-methyltransferase n=1 Tax=Archangium gephyra TaxID=48 RepID=A0A2W5TNB7_9BACT|nr:MAG: chemotaxis protein CheR [Archangium gephyra]
MSAEELHLLRDIFSKASGFHLREELKFIAERRLASRLELLGLRDYAAYARYLRFDARGADELETAIDLLVPHETYFFREPVQLRCFEEEVLPLLEKKNERTHGLHVWSAGCSTGEEAYTLSMLLQPRPSLAGWRIDILGTDLSRKALTTARKAEYGSMALRATSTDQRARFFEPLDGGRVKVKAPYRADVRFGQLNLLDAAASSLLPRFDVIFCRNVLIYFDQATRRKVVEHFYERLNDGGYLLLGHSENLLHLSTRFELVQLKGDLVYRRP